MKILGMYPGHVYNFPSMEDAVKVTRISEKRILWCIKTGRRWRAWTFDEIL